MPTTFTAYDTDEHPFIQIAKRDLDDKKFPTEAKFDNPSGVLYEAMTVGIAPNFNNIKTHKFSENAFRAALKVAARTEYNV